MSGSEFFEHTKDVVKTAIPHEWDVFWNTHMRKLFYSIFLLLVWLYALIFSSL